MVASRRPWHAFVAEPTIVHRTIGSNRRLRPRLRAALLCGKVRGAPERAGCSPPACSQVAVTSGSRETSTAIACNAPAVHDSGPGAGKPAMSLFRSSPSRPGILTGACIGDLERPLPRPPASGERPHLTMGQGERCNVWIRSSQFLQCIKWVGSFANKTPLATVQRLFVAMAASAPMLRRRSFRTVRIWTVDPAAGCRCRQPTAASDAAAARIHPSVAAAMLALRMQGLRLLRSVGPKARRHALIERHSLSANGGRSIPPAGASSGLSLPSATARFALSVDAPVQGGCVPRAATWRAAALLQERLYCGSTCTAGNSRLQGGGTSVLSMAVQASRQAVGETLLTLS